MSLSSMLACPPGKLCVLLPPLLAMAVEVEDGGFVVGLEQPEAARHFLVGLLNSAEILAEAVLVELLVGLDVPQPATVGADLVGQDHAREVAVPDAPELELEVDQADADRSEHARQEVVH